MTHENNDQLLDIYEMWYKPFWQTDWFFYAMIMITCAILGCVAWYVYKFFFYKKLRIDCAQLAYHDLDILKNFHIVTLADSKESYFKLSLIIKNYLTARYKIACMQLTDEEIIVRMHDYIDSEQLEQLRTLFRNMTCIKFERKFATTEKLEKDIQVLQDFIQKTTPQPQIKEN